MNEVYKYKGVLYTVIREGEMKNPETRKWVECVIYVSSESGKTYVRESVEFYYLFEKV